jgi:hypothetical protein
MTRPRAERARDELRLQLIEQLREQLNGGRSIREAVDHITDGWLVRMFADPPSFAAYIERSS